MTLKEDRALTDMSFIHSQIHTIPGWFFEEDIHLFQRINSLQRESRRLGDILEIGPYLGKSSVLLGQGLAEGERLVVCDLFGLDIGSDVERKENQKHYQNLTRDAFEKNYLRFNDQLPEIIQGHSNELDLPANTFRFIHIDGSHQYAAARKDAEISRTLILDGGVIVFDDYRAVHTPGVAAVVWSSVANGEIKPLCLTPHKFYGYVNEDSLNLTRAIIDWATATKMLVDMEHIAGIDFPRIAAPKPKASLLKRIYWEIRK